MARLIDGLVAHGVPARMAGPAVRALATSPELAAACRAALPGRRALQVVDLMRRQLATLTNIPRRRALEAAEFYEQCFAAQLPAVITDLVTSWPAFGKWTPSYLRDRYGEVLVDVTQGREADPEFDRNTAQHTTSMKLAEFADRVLAAGTTNDFYMVARGRNTARPELSSLFDDINPPPGLLEREHLPSSSALWFGPAGTVTPLHHDTSSILFCQLFGRKHVKLVPPLALEMYEHAQSLYSRLDPEAPATLPPSALLLQVTLEPGEALFIPAGYWHHVRALDVSISLALNGFVRPNHFDWFRPGELRAAEGEAAKPRL